MRVCGESYRITMKDYCGDSLVGRGQTLYGFWHYDSDCVAFFLLYDKN